MRAALRDKRMDLLTLMFKDHPSFLDLIRGLNEIPNSAFKDEVVVMMLQTESGFWKSEEPISNGSRGVSFENAIDPFAGVIAKHLPAITINEELFSTKANRGKLAAELKGAIATKSSSSLNEVELPKNDRSPHERQAESPTKDLNHMNSAPRSEERKRNNASDLEKPVPFTWWITASCIALLLLVFSAWFKARKSKSDG